MAHPDQTGAPAGGLRFILSLRAVGEGHVSSLTFRSGTIAADGAVSIEPTGAPGGDPEGRQAHAGRRTAKSSSCVSARSRTSASG